MSLKRILVTTMAGSAFMLSFVAAQASTTFMASCAGVASATNVQWTGTVLGGVSPIAVLWGNGSTSSVQTVASQPGIHSMTFQATDASSSVATSTCSATIAATTTPGTTISAQIEALFAQITVLKAQLMSLLMQQHQVTGENGNAASSTPATCFDFHRDLHDGDKGDDVRELQRSLSRDPSILPPAFITGFFGHRTEEAVKKFQERFEIFSNGSSTSGFVGMRTRGFIKKHCEMNDNDNDGTPDNQDNDDDNDGIPDMKDAHPFNADFVSSTTVMQSHNDHQENQGNHHGKRDSEGDN